jgi:PKD repeat protein
VDASGDLAAVSHTVSVGVAPTVAFSSTPTQAAAGYPVHLSGAASHDPNTGASITTYAWSFGDGTSGTGKAPSHTYAKPGVYSVTLKITDSFGLVASKTSSLTVSAPGKIVSLATRRVGTGEFLVVTVSQAGKIQVGTATATLTKAGSASFRVGTAPAPHHQLKVNVTVVYTPQAGPVVRQTYSKVIQG